MRRRRVWTLVKALIASPLKRTANFPTVRKIFLFSTIVFGYNSATIIITCECWWALTFWQRVSSSFGGNHYQFCYCGMNQKKRQLSSSSSTESLDSFRIPKIADRKATPKKADSVADSTSSIKVEVMEAGDSRSVSEVEDLDDNQLEDIERRARSGLSLEDTSAMDTAGPSGASGGGGISTNNDSTNNSGTTWAEAAAGGANKRVKKDYPFTLYVQQGQLKREPITKAHFSAFEKQLWKERLRLSPEDNAKIIIDFVTHHQGYGVVACVNHETAQWVRKVASGFKFGPTLTRAWARWERTEAHVYSAFLQGSCYKDADMKPKYVLSTILKFNGLQGTFDIITWKSVPSGIYFCMEPKGLLAAKMSRITRLNGGNCVLHLEKRLRKARTEAEFLEFQRKKEEDLIQRQAASGKGRGKSSGAAGSC